MPNLSAKFASALVLGVVVGAGATILPRSEARAADNCLTEPNRDGTPQGKHWYFHIERGTGRHCWYLRAPDDKAVRADTIAAAAEQPAPLPTESATARSIENAHAEIGPRTPVPDDASGPRTAPAAPATAVAPSVWPTPQAAAPTANSPVSNAPATAPIADQSSVASRWPQASDATTTAAAQPDASPMVDDTAADSSTATEPTPQVLAPARPAAAPVARNIGSLQKLLLVAFGALALAGLTGSAVYRLGRRRKRKDWLHERTNWHSMDNPLDPPWAEPRHAKAVAAVPDLDEARYTISRSQPSHAFEPDQSGDRVERIEEFLMRLTKQLEAELEKPRPAMNEEPRGVN